MQHDYEIDNSPGATVRADINNALEALTTNNSGASEPAALFANMWWFDTSTNILKQRDNANTEWISVAFKDASGWIPYRQGTQLGDAAVLSKDTDGTLAANSDAEIATQKATKTYVDGKFNTSTGHKHDASDSKKVLATNLDMTGITSGHVIYNNAGTPAGLDLSPTTQVKDVETTGVNFSNSVQADVLSVAKTITSGKTVLLVASGYVTAAPSTLVTPTIRLKNGTTISQTIVMGTIGSGDKKSWACSAIVTGLSGSVTFSVTVIAGEAQGSDNLAFGNLVVLEF